MDKENTELKETLQFKEISKEEAMEKLLDEEDVNLVYVKVRNGFTGIDYNFIMAKNMKWSFAENYNEDVININYATFFKIVGNN